MDLAQKVSSRLSYDLSGRQLFPSVFDGIVEDILFVRESFTLPQEFEKIREALLYGEGCGYSLVTMWSILGAYLSQEIDTLLARDIVFLESLFVGVDVREFRRRFYLYLRDAVSIRD